MVITEHKFISLVRSSSKTHSCTTSLPCMNLAPYKTLEVRSGGISGDNGESREGGALLSCRLIFIGE
jgi:hypothetical protein